MNTITELTQVDFSTDELWFLLGQFSPAYVIGVENPHLGWLIEEIEEADRAAVQALIQRGIIQVIDSGNIEVDDTIAAMIRGIAHPEHTLIVNGGNDKKDAGQARYIHFANGLIIEHIEIEAGRHQLGLIKDRDEILIHLKEILRADTKTKGSGSTFILPEDILYKATSLYSNGEGTKGRKLLQKSGLEPACADSLADTLKKPVANASFTVVCNQNDPSTQYVRGFGILEGTEQFWMMKPVESEGQHMVDFTAANARSVRKHLIELLP